MTNSVNARVKHHSKVNFGSKKMFGQKDIGSKKSLDPKKFRSKMILSPIDFESKVILDQKNFWVKKNFGSKKFWFKKNCLDLKTFGQIKFWVAKIFGPKKIWAQYFLMGVLVLVAVALSQENKVNSYSNQLKLSCVCKLEWSLTKRLYMTKQDHTI